VGILSIGKFFHPSIHPSILPAFLPACLTNQTGDKNLGYVPQVHYKT
jgi:hypothetical protein